MFRPSMVLPQFGILNAPLNNDGGTTLSYFIYPSPYDSVNYYYFSNQPSMIGALNGYQMTNVAEYNPVGSYAIPSYNRDTGGYIFYVCSTAKPNKKLARGRILLEGGLPWAFNGLSTYSTSLDSTVEWFRIEWDRQYNADYGLFIWQTFTSTLSENTLYINTEFDSLPCATPQPSVAYIPTWFWTLRLEYFA
jgi:hypothetical protein